MRLNDLRGIKGLSFEEISIEDEIENAYIFSLPKTGNLSPLDLLTRVCECNDSSLTFFEQAEFTTEGLEKLTRFRVREYKVSDFKAGEFLKRNLATLHGNLITDKIYLTTKTMITGGGKKEKNTEINKDVFELLFDIAERRFKVIRVLVESELDGIKNLSLDFYIDNHGLLANNFKLDIEFDNIEVRNSFDESDIDTYLNKYFKKPIDALEIDNLVKLRNPKMYSLHERLIVARHWENTIIK